MYDTIDMCVYIYIYTYYTIHTILYILDYYILYTKILYYIILHTPSPPTKSFPTKSPRVKLSGSLPIKSYGRENSHPLELRVCLSQTL